jgi:predicted nucleic acid-binding protein
VAFVLDASAALPWCFADEATPSSWVLLARAQARETVIVPAHWPAEMLSALLRGKRRGRIDDAQTLTFLKELHILPIVVEDPPRVSELASLKATSERLELNAYDAVYFELARTTGLPLATLDDALIRACRAEGVEVI